MSDALQMLQSQLGPGTTREGAALEDFVYDNVTYNVQWVIKNVQVGKTSHCVTALCKKNIDNFLEPITLGSLTDKSLTLDTGLHILYLAKPMLRSTRSLDQ